MNAMSVSKLETVLRNEKKVNALFMSIYIFESVVSHFCCS
jgi:hypothetical protein